jgi:predicted esterase
MLERWTDVASHEDVILLAPNSLHTDVGWDFHTDGPDFVHALIDTVAANHPVDFRRLYLFGQSGGAVYTLTLAMLESEYFAAAALHAGAWRLAAEYRVMDYAKRKIPISIWVGDEDEYFSLSSVKNTQCALAGAAFPVELNLLTNRHHSLLDVPPDFNANVFAFLGRHALGDISKYVPYRLGATRP